MRLCLAAMQMGMAEEKQILQLQSQAQGWLHGCETNSLSQHSLRTVLRQHYVAICNQ
jgi:hypothetical protein